MERVPIKANPHYSIDREGNVYGPWGRKNGCWLNQEGYCIVNLGHRPYRLHRLLAIAFIPNPRNYPLVRHLNDNKLDNRLENLEWGGPADNWADHLLNKYPSNYTE